ncbi:MAG: class I SAM-dependent RNA methyltransferase [Treponema sp.]|jgi:putative N6-adenine-specific DNA methylase|nr:class I SAM-dependent RNA methyltransferase [Treponema sp.]
MFTVWALCAIGVEKVVSHELKKLAMTVQESAFGRVRFCTDLYGLYYALYGLRAADRLLLEVGSFKAENFDDLFDGVRSIHWEQYIPRDMGVSITKVRTNRSILHAETSIQAVTHKAIAEQLCTKYRVPRLPDDDDRGAHVRIFIEKDTVFVLLDISGEPLFKRSYRVAGGIAPIRETTAASILLLCGWKRKFSLYDPFCGSGTIAIEAALYAWNAAPGLGRTFAIDTLNIHNPQYAQTVWNEFFQIIDFSRPIRIYGSDSLPQAVAYAQENSARAYRILHGKDDPKVPVFSVCAMEHASAADQEGFIVTNPPYGLRLGNRTTAEKNYTAMAILKDHFPAWKLCILSDHAGFESFFGMKAAACHEITNGPLQLYCYIYH